MGAHWSPNTSIVPEANLNSLTVAVVYIYIFAVCCIYIILQQAVLLTKVALFEPIVTQSNKSIDAVKTFFNHNTRHSIILNRNLFYSLRLQKMIILPYSLIGNSKTTIIVKV